MRDSLGPARGLVYGIGAALVFWIIVAGIVCAVAACSPLRIAEDDAGWIPALYGNGAGHLNVFASPFPSLEEVTGMGWKN